jgi:hypothetical protein
MYASNQRQQHSVKTLPAVALVDGDLAGGDRVEILGHLIGGPVPASWQAIPPK